jgi:hypothetical protein
VVFLGEKTLDGGLKTIERTCSFVSFLVVYFSASSLSSVCICVCVYVLGLLPLLDATDRPDLKGMGGGGPKKKAKKKIF